MHWCLKSCFTVSMFTCVGFAIDRYLALTQVSKYNGPKSMRNTKIFIVSYWIAGFIFTSSYYYCKKFPIFKWTRSLILFPVSFVMFFTVNIIVYKKLHTKIIDLNEEKKMKHEIRIAQTFSIIFLVYIVLFCPFFTVKCLVDIFGLYEFPISEDIRWVFRHLKLLNSCVNSLIYAYRVKTIRDGLKKLFGISHEGISKLQLDQISL